MVPHPEFMHHTQPKVGHSRCCCLDFVEGHVLLCQSELLVMARFIDFSLKFCVPGYSYRSESLLDTFDG